MLLTPRPSQLLQSGSKQISLQKLKKMEMYKMKMQEEEDANYTNTRKEFNYQKLKLLFYFMLNLIIVLDLLLCLYRSARLILSVQISSFLRIYSLCMYQMCMCNYYQLDVKVFQQIIFYPGDISVELFKISHLLKKSFYCHQ